jgi:hypothetical protein
MKSNKFNASWQLARVQAKSIKDVDAKIWHVLRHFDENKNEHDKDRVLNWLNTTAIAYKDVEIKEKFNFAKSLVNSAAVVDEDNKCVLSDISRDDILLIRKDLSKRKYNFQFKKTPQAHINFMEMIEEILNAH